VKRETSSFLSTEAKDSRDPLRFPVAAYTVKTLTVTTSAGESEIVYRHYERVTYVANPVDAEFQSLNVKVPIKVDGKDIDATNAPILFDVKVGGYLSSLPGLGPQFPPGEGPQFPPGDCPRFPPPVSPAPDGGPPSVIDPGLVLAAGYVIVEPGCRGRDNQAADGTYYGKAPAGIVDLKAAVRYLRHNRGILPGNVDWIISVGGSAGGALSALLGASGNSHLYDAYLEAIGAADQDDSIYASAAFCPITDLEHADMAYEWEFGTTPVGGALADQELSQQLKKAFAEYLASLRLLGQDDFGLLTADNYGEYLVRTYLVPSAGKYLLALTDEELRKYLAENPWITWSDASATFAFEDYVAHVGRMKCLPAFDDFALIRGEPILFGDETADARHYTTFSLRHTGGDQNAELDAGLKTLVDLMNPMYFITQGCSGCAAHWWIRHGTSDNDTALPVIIDLATSLENRGKDVNTLLYWDGQHMAAEDPEDFIAWIGRITGYTR
jgi:hypothetical protein